MFFHQESVNYLNKCSKHLFIEISFGDCVCFLKFVIMISNWTDFFSHPVTVINLCVFFPPNRMCSHVYFNFCLNLAAPWYICVKWTCILETNDASISFHVSSNISSISLTTDSRGTELPPSPHTHTVLCSRDEETGGY